jgi:hypothetical protein
MTHKNYKSIIKISLILFLSIYLSGCMRYLTQDRGKVLLDNVDIDQSIKVAEIYMKDKGGERGASLALWAIRDQHFTPEQAAEVSRLYFRHVDGLKKDFDVWHLTWAIANIYRHGDEEVKGELQKAYDHATKRAKEVSDIADKMANGEKMYLGDAHGGGRAFAKRHVVVPGNKKYLQSVEEYKEKGKKKEK